MRGGERGGGGRDLMRGLRGLVCACLCPVLHSQGPEACAPRRVPGVADDPAVGATRCQSEGWPAWLNKSSWCETGCGITVGVQECCEASCCHPSPPPPPSDAGRCAPIHPGPDRNSKCGWVGWPKMLDSHEPWCASGCGVPEGKECCEPSCCEPQAPPPDPSCVPFDLTTRHLVVVSDISSARRQLSRADNHSMIALAANTAVTVGCEPDYITPPNLAYLQGVDVLKCTSGGSNAVARTRLTCVPPGKPVSTVGVGGVGTDDESFTDGTTGHFGVSLMTLAGFCAAAFATVVGKRKQLELGLELHVESDSGSRRRVSQLSFVMPQVAFGAAIPACHIGAAVPAYRYGGAVPEIKDDEVGMEMGMMGGSGLRLEALKSVDSELSTPPAAPGDAPNARDSIGSAGELGDQLYGDQLWMPPSPSSDEDTEVPSWQLASGDFSATDEVSTAYEGSTDEFSATDEPYAHTFSRRSVAPNA